MRFALTLLVAASIFGVAKADPREAPNLMTLTSAFDAPLAAVRTDFDAPAGTAVRLMVYDSEEAFLDAPRIKLEAPLNEQGVALLPLEGLEPGVYALAAYLDENGDGKLNRGGLFGFPKEPIAFSNGVKIKLGKPRFEKAKVALSSGEIVEITLDD